MTIDQAATPPAATDAPVSAGVSRGPASGPLGSIRRLWDDTPWFSRVVLFVVIIATWQTLIHLYGRPFMARPSRIARAIPSVLSDPRVWEEAQVSFSLVGSGLLISVVVGLVIGVLMGQVRWCEQAFAPYVNGAYATPIIAVLPLLTLWLGFSNRTAFALIIFAGLPPMAIAAWDGTRSVDRRFMEVAHSYRAPKRAIWTGVAIPSSLPYLVAGLRLSSGRALSAVVIAEFLTSTNRGLGTLVMRWAGNFRHDEAVVLIGLFVVAGLLLTYGVEWLIARTLPWYRKD